MERAILVPKCWGLWRKIIEGFVAVVEHPGDVLENSSARFKFLAKLLQKESDVWSENWM